MSTAKLVWDDAALDKLAKAPFFIRKFARSKVEKAAIEQGITQITLEFMEQVRLKVMNKPASTISE